MKKPANTDEYISSFPEGTQALLQQIRTAIKQAAPNAEEVISYNMPGFRQDGMLVWFAGNKEHIGFYPTPGPIKTFAADLAKYKTSKGAIQFPISKPIPVALVKKITKYRLTENAAKAKLKQKKQE